MKAVSDQFTASYRTDLLQPNLEQVVEVRAVRVLLVNRVKWHMAQQEHTGRAVIAVFIQKRSILGPTSGFGGGFRSAFSDGHRGRHTLLGDRKSRFSSSLARFDSQLAAVLSWRRSLLPGNITHRCYTALRSYTLYILHSTALYVATLRGTRRSFVRSDGTGHWLSLQRCKCSPLLL